MPKVTFLIYEKSYLIRKGLITVIEKVSNTETLFHSDNIKEIIGYLKNSEADFIILNPSILKNKSLKEMLKANLKSCQLIALTDDSSFVNDNTFNWVEYIFLSDSQSTILKKINKLVGNKETQQKKHTPDEISKREAEILKYIALGYSNKEIADTLFLSTHTIITHRKNITRKLGIKTVPGLTIYAILNKIIDINDTT